MLSKTQFWRRFAVGAFYVSLLLKTTATQGVACYKCMTTDPNNDNCRDPFSSLINNIQDNCQATSKDKDGTFPARFCVKITGRVTSVDSNANASFLNTVIYYRTCVVDNIMDSTNSLETTGNFRLQGFQSMAGAIRLQGFMSLCTYDGCNHGRLLHSSLSTIIASFLLLICMPRFLF